MTVSKGTCLVLSRKFSARKFWDEVIEQKVTILSYIGEIGRYLVNSHSLQDFKRIKRQSRVRIAIGNGLKADVWEKFADFGIKEIGEFYSATEANSGLIHHWKIGQDGVGACGKIGPLLSIGFQVYIVEYDAATELPVRNSRGFCRVVKRGKVGLFSLISRYDGYLNRPLDDEKKILRNVFSNGDAYFRTGDLFRQDDTGRYYYFVDRVGDTVRCKGENISTIEVESQVSAYPGVMQVCVYGVTVDGYDGGFGMAALVADDSFRVKGLLKFLNEKLPGYAIPRFLRFVDELDATGTFKFQKHSLRSKGITGSSLYWVCVGDLEYTPFEEKQRVSLTTKRPRL